MAKPFFSHPLVLSDVQLWRVSGGGITPTDPTDSVSIPGGQAGVGSASLILGSNLAKARVQTTNATTPAWIAVTANRDAVAGTQDDTSKPSWELLLNAQSDAATLYRQPAGGSLAAALTVDGTQQFFANGIDGSSCNVHLTGANASGNGAFLRFRQSRGTLASPTPTINGDNLGQVGAWGCAVAGSYAEQAVLRWNAAESWTNTARGTSCTIYTTPAGTASATSYLNLSQAGDLAISGNNATKATGTVWINPSDTRLKQAVLAYPRGLAEVVQLQPIAYQYNGLAGTQEGQPAVGLDAEAVEAVFPECVQTKDVLLHPDDPAPTTIRLLDISAILFALINAIKELHALIPGPPVATTSP